MITFKPIVFISLWLNFNFFFDLGFSFDKVCWPIFFFLFMLLHEFKDLVLHFFFLWLCDVIFFLNSSATRGNIWWYIWLSILFSRYVDNMIWLFWFWFIIFLKLFLVLSCLKSFKSHLHILSSTKYLLLYRFFILWIKARLNLFNFLFFRP